VEITKDEWQRWRTDKVTKAVYQRVREYMNEIAHELAQGVDREYYLKSVGEYTSYKEFLEMEFYDEDKTD